MAAPTEVYVNPAIAGASGAGTLADPYGDLQHALDSVTRDAANGNRFNIKAGTAEIMAATMNWATYGNPSNGTPVIFQGYTAAAGDGGIGSISGGAGNFPICTAKNYVQFKDLELFNTGSAFVLTLGQNATIDNCEVHTSTGGGISATVHGVVLNNYIHNVGVYGITGVGCVIAYNYLANGTNVFTSAIRSTGGEDVQIFRNIISIGGASQGIEFDGTITYCEHNSILSAGGTGIGILVSAVSNIGGSLLSNLVEGFSGSGGVGIQSDLDFGDYGANAVYNCETAYNIAADIRLLVAANETLSATPFAKSGSNTRALRGTYFAPVDTGAVYGGGYPSVLALDKGAVQHGSGGGAGGGGGTSTSGLGDRTLMAA